MRRVLALLLALSPVLISANGLVAQTVSTLTADEKKDVDAWQLKRQLTAAYKQIAELQSVVGSCQGQLGAYQGAQNQQALDAEAKTLIESFEKAHPGFTLDVQSGTATKKPDPPKSAEKK